MPCCLAISRGLRQFELPADTRRKDERKGEGRERAKVATREGSPAYPREYGQETGQRGLEREREMWDLCLVREGCGMKRRARIDERKRKREGVRGEGGEETWHGHWGREIE